MYLRADILCSVEWHDELCINVLAAVGIWYILFLYMGASKKLISLFGTLQ
jgi:hypothetical protein